MSLQYRFTNRALKSVEFAKVLAQNMQAEYIGTEHLLLGIAYDQGGVAARALAEMGIDFPTLQMEVMQMEGEETDSSNPYYTPLAKQVMEQTLEAAGSLGHNYIGTEHILLGLLNVQDCAAMRVLNNLGVEASLLRQTVLNLLGSLEQFPGQPGRASKKSNTPLLDKYGRNLNAMAGNEEMDPVIGRTKEIQRVIQILSRRTKNNPILIGEPGVGKTAIAEGLAQRIVQGDVPMTLREKRVFSLSMASMVAGAKYRGEFEERLKGTMEEIIRAKNIILFIDEIHTLVGAGAAEGALDAANIMKPALSRGEVQVIGATTLDEYKKHLEKDAALSRRFQTIMVEEPTVDDAMEILRGIKDKYESFHRAQIDDEAVSAAVKLSHRYISDRFLPDKAIDLMDEAASKVRMSEALQPEEMKALEEQEKHLNSEKEAAIAAQEYERAAYYRDEARRVKAKLTAARKQLARKENTPITVTADDIADVVSLWTGIPVHQIAAQESEKLLNLEKILHERVIGQNEAIAAVAQAVRRARAGLRDPKRPIGSFLFLGPTGVGKTELARALATALFDSEESIVRFDMSEYMEKYSVSRMVGAPPGYVGYEEGGQLTDAVRRHPYSIILLDEIEKAHPDVFNLLLQVLEDGRLTDGHGRTVDFRNTVIIMTSNAGASHLRSESTAMGFAVGDNSPEGEYERAKKRVLEEVKRLFKPEFLNRVDEQLVFHALGKEELREIVEILLKDVRKRLGEKNIDLAVSDAAKDLLVGKGTDFKYGARPLKRAIQKMVEDEMAAGLLAGEFAAGDTIEVSAADGGEGSDGKTAAKLTFSKREATVNEPATAEA
ncbi:MAG: ATP-dependent Clp protease ATP-binding subunit [Selenomonadaceae bacterium]|nr:ATP-dependent Clp protease ATP-binding subunit [Selenomonadaceae bacterium]